MRTGPERSGIETAEGPQTVAVALVPPRLPHKQLEASVMELFGHPSEAGCTGSPCHDLGCRYGLGSSSGAIRLGLRANGGLGT
jgi:hypothetical protein